MVVPYEQFIEFQSIAFDSYFKLFTILSLTTPYVKYNSFFGLLLKMVKIQKIKCIFYISVLLKKINLD